MEISKNLEEKLKKISAVNRRLDSLAKLLARGSGSTCVAVSILDDQLIVASNDFFCGTQKGKNKKFDNVQKILDFFQKVSEKKLIDPNERKSIFILICSLDKSSISEIPYSTQLGEKGFEAVINDVISGKPVSPDNYKKQFGKARKAAWDANSAFSDLYRKFNKVEKWLMKEDNLTEINPKHFKGSTILTKEFESGVHAEMQILTEALKKLESSTETEKKEIYIGISKLCCLDCDCMLMAVNQLKLGDVSYRGAHKLEFEKNWKIPLGFFRKKEKKNWHHETWENYWIFKDSEKLIETKEEIKEKELLKIKAEHEKDEKEYKFQSASPSSSEHSTPMTMGIEFYENFPVHILLNLQKKLKHEQDDWEELKGNETLKLMLNLLEIQEFSDLFEETSLTPGNATIRFNLILEKLQQTAQNPSKEECLKIIKNDRLVGKKVAEYFRGISESLKDNEKQQKKDQDKKFNDVFEKSKKYWKEKGFKYDSDFELELELAKFISLDENKEFKEQKNYLNSLNQGEVKDVFHDGFCLFHAIVDQIREKNVNIKGIKDPEKVTTSDIIKLIAEYLEENWAKYQDVLIGDSENEMYVHLLDQLEKYLQLGNYNQSIGDLMPKMLSDALDINIVVHDATTKSTHSFNSNSKMLIKLGRVNNNHYMVMNTQSQPNQKRKIGNDYDQESESENIKKMQKLNEMTLPSKKDNPIDFKSSQTTSSTLNSSSTLSQSWLSSTGLTHENQMSLEENRPTLEQLQKTREAEKLQKIKSHQTTEVQKAKQTNVSMTPQMDNAINQKNDEEQQKAKEVESRHSFSSNNKK